jgi:hypothetical protein
MKQLAKYVTMVPTMLVASATKTAPQLAPSLALVTNQILPCAEMGHSKMAKYATTATPMRAVPVMQTAAA